MDQKQKAEELFLNTEKTQKEIADAVGIDPKTLYRWIQQGQWRELKSATRRMPSVLVENIYAQLDDINYNISQRERGNRHPTKDESLTIKQAGELHRQSKKANLAGTEHRVPNELHQLRTTQKRWPRQNPHRIRQRIPKPNHPPRLPSLRHRI